MPREVLAERLPYHPLLDGRLDARGLQEEPELRAFVEQTRYRPDPLSVDLESLVSDGEVEERLRVVAGDGLVPHAEASPESAERSLR